MTKLRLVVEVLYATHLLPGDGEGSASAYVEVSFDAQRLRTKTKLKDLSPVWNEKLEFTVSDPELLDEEVIEANVYTADRKSGHRHLLGRAKVKPEHIRNRDSENAPVPIPIPLEKGWSIFTRNRGELYLTVYYYDEARGSQGQHQFKRESSSSSESDSVGKGPSALPEDGSSRRADCQPSSMLSSGKHVSATTMLRLEVMVLRAFTLFPGDGEGSASPYVEVTFDSQRLRTKTKQKDLDPEWNETLEFSVSDPEVLEKEFVEVNVYTERKRGPPHLLGRAKVKPQNRDSENAPVFTVTPIPLKKGWSIFARKTGELYLTVYYYDVARGSPGQHRLTRESSSSVPSVVSSESDSAEKGPSASREDGSSRQADFRSSDSTEKWDNDPVLTA